MEYKRLSLAMMVSAVAACNQTAPQQPVSNESNPPSPVALPDDRTPLEEPNGPIDPKSTEAAGQVVQHYAALLEQRRFPEAEQLWGDPSSARAFSDKLGVNEENHVEVGKPGDMEGAAGSSYVTVPVIFYGKDQNEVDFRRAAEVILRRVNDVPGSTEAQRRWHVERIDWK